MLAIQIDNKDLEKSFLEFAKNQKKSVEKLMSDAIKFFLEHQKQDRLKYPQKDISKHIKKISRDYDEDDCADKALTHIKNSADFIHKLRREKSLV